MYTTIIYNSFENRFYERMPDEYQDPGKTIFGIVFTDSSYLFWNYEYETETIVCVLYCDFEENINKFYCGVSPFCTEYLNDLEYQNFNIEFSSNENIDESC